MDCQGCGRGYSDRLPRCPSCKLRPGKPIIEESKARLIEFPRRAATGVAESAAVVLPAWRQELNARVRARRSEQAAAAVAEGIIDEGQSDRAPLSPVPSHPGDTEIRRPANSIVEAALNRVRRANRHALRAGLPKIEPARNVSPGVVTPNVLDEDFARSRYKDWDETNAALYHGSCPPGRLAHQPQPDDGCAAVEEIPIDYLGAEVRRVNGNIDDVHDGSGERVTAGRPTSEDVPPTRGLIFGVLVDLVVPALGTLPLALIAWVVGADLSRGRSLAGLSATFVVVALYYLVLTQSLGGRTFGMMLTGSRVISLHGSGKLSPGRSLIRSAALLISAAPMLIGVFWALLNPTRRGWHDYISGTRVVPTQEP